MLKNSVLQNWHRACADFPIVYVSRLRENMIRYKGYLVLRNALRLIETRQTGGARRAVFLRTARRGDPHLDGVIFESQQAAEAHGLGLCKKWVDENLKSIDDV